MTFEELSNRIEAAGLAVAAAFHPKPDDLAPEGCQTLMLLAPHEPGFWPRITARPPSADPVDDWSIETITTLAETLMARALFPFGGPPYQPFIRWALASGQVWQSPLGMLVHDRQGLFISFRGALAFEQKIALPGVSKSSPCETCTTQPCRSACPVDAFASGSYDIPKCTGFLATSEGQPCLQTGCNIRRSCPVSQNWPRLPEQSAHHMEIFFRNNT